MLRLVCVSLLLPLCVAVAAEEVVRPVGARLLFIPNGFDDNDVSEVVIDGYLPNGCYRVTEPKVEFFAARREFVITPMARYFNMPCIEALVPFTQDVHLGVLPVGAYTVKVASGAQSNPPVGALRVSEALSAGPDDYLYAPVEAVSVRSEEGEFIASISGRFTVGCMRLDRVEFRESNRTLALLPIAVAEGVCIDQDRPFHADVRLPKITENGRYLLHVRSLSGKALNTVFYKTDRS